MSIKKKFPSIRNPHTNIVDIKGFCKVRTENLNGFDNAYFVAMEYAESNLENFIQNRKQNNENFTFRGRFERDS
jgi:hypothetical protein